MTTKGHPMTETPETLAQRLGLEAQEAALGGQDALAALLEEASEAAAALEAQAAQIAERDAQIEALRVDAERWQKWLPWMRNINRKPYGLAREIDAIDAAMAAKDPR
jgi:hypothetical protein